MEKEKVQTKIAYVYMKLAEQSIAEDAPLNVLVLVKNLSDERLVEPIRLYLSAADGEADFRLAVCEKRALAASHIEHLYFSVPAERFSSDFWDGVVHEEFIVAGGSTANEAAHNTAARQMVFIERN